MENFKTKHFIIFAVVLFTALACTKLEVQKNNKAADNQYVDYVNPYIGNISHLLVPTFPTVHLPNSMLRVKPERRDYTSERLKGLPVITTKHRAGGDFSICPVSNKSDDLKPLYYYSYDNEELTPYSYEVYLDEENIDVSFSLSHQSGIYYFNYNNKDNKYLLINTTNGQLTIGDKYVSGYKNITPHFSNHETRIYLYLESDSDFAKSGILENGKITTEKTAKGKDICTALKLKDDTELLKIRYGVSLISEEQAKKNLYREMSDFDKEKIAKRGREIWNKTLAKTSVDGGTEDDRTVFYTSIYRTYERPICISEDGKYFSAYDGNVHDDNGNAFYTDDWIWDTYRATHPLRVLIEPKMELNILKSYIKMAEQMKNMWMPTFPTVGGDARGMNSNHGVATIIDAYNKGLTNFDLEKAYLACKGSITERSLIPWSRGEAGVLDKFFKEKGYFPALKEGEKETVKEVSIWEMRQPVAVTLGTVYDEWCLSQIAKILDKKDEYKYFLNRSYNYRKLFNSKTGFFHPKDSQGKFIEPFDYTFSGGQGTRLYYDENNGWVYRWDVQHNFADLVDLMGGREKFVENLETTFNKPIGINKFEFYYQLPDHTGNIGQFSMANEPSLHIPYLYNYAGQPWKTQKSIKKIIHEWFRNDLMGIPGDEDGGGMSAFVSFSMLGFYPVTPGIPAYNIGSPFFEKATIDLGNGKKFEIIANNLNPNNKYIQKASLNGKEWNKPWFAHDDIKNGATLILQMGPHANRDWGSSVEATPPSAEAYIE
jgi:predicted alpha-1,2-mannosidase